MYANRCTLNGYGSVYIVGSRGASQLGGCLLGTPPGVKQERNNPMETTLHHSLILLTQENNIFSWYLRIAEIPVVKTGVPGYIVANVGHAVSEWRI